jgi:UPF0755 protein
MIKKILAFIIVLLVLVGGYALYKFKLGKTKFAGESKMFYIRTDAANKSAILESLVKDSICSDPSGFEFVANRMDYWRKIKPGRYKIPRGTNLIGLVKILRNGIQTPVELVISRKIRLKQDFARLIGNNFEADSASVMDYLMDKDSMQVFGLDSATWITSILHNTYAIPWTFSPAKIFRKLYSEQEKFWSANNRLDKAKALGFTPEQVYTLASIVAEETNKDADKPKIASTYMNRLAKGMRLQADPTVKFAMKNFLVNRILYSYLKYESPYNTYIHAGLPPGPICTVSGKTIDAVLDAPKTDYLYFVADADLRGGSSFSSTIEQHQKLAKEYQDSLTVFLKRKALQAQK